jgi:hypothetical protein
MPQAEATRLCSTNFTAQIKGQSLDLVAKPVRPARVGHGQVGEPFAEHLAWAVGRITKETPDDKLKGDRS